MTPEMKQIVAELAKAWEQADRVVALKKRWPELGDAIQVLVDEYKKEQ